MNEYERILQKKMKGYLWSDGKFIICIACCKLQVDYVFRQLEEASCSQTLQVLMGTWNTLISAEDTTQQGTISPDFYSALMITSWHACWRSQEERFSAGSHIYKHGEIRVRDSIGCRWWISGFWGKRIRAKNRIIILDFRKAEFGLWPSKTCLEESQGKQSWNTGTVLQMPKPTWIDSSKHCERQQEGFLKIYQQQMED